METQSKTPVDIIQEMIAILATRKEAVNKLGADIDQQKFANTKEQTDTFIAELLPELSNFGDAVKDSPSRDNEYQLTWNNALSTRESLGAEEAGVLFEKLETILKESYRQLAATKDELPASLAELLASQEQRLK